MKLYSILLLTFFSFAGCSNTIEILFVERHVSTSMRYSCLAFEDYWVKRAGYEDAIGRRVLSNDQTNELVSEIGGLEFIEDNVFGYYYDIKFKLGDDFYCLSPNGIIAKNDDYLAVSDPGIYDLVYAWIWD